VTALIAWPNFHREMEREVDKQVAAPAETRTANFHRAKQNRSSKECGWKGGDSGASAGRKSLVQRRTAVSDQPSALSKKQLLTTSG